MVTICKPERVSIFINTNKLTMAQIKQQTGCDYIINGGLYNMSKLTPCCHLKSNGVIYSSEAWTRLGLGWNGLTFGMGYDMSKFDNYITCVELVNNGICQLSYPSAMSLSSVSGFEWCIYPTTSSGSTTTYFPDDWYFVSSCPCLYSGGVYGQGLNYGLLYVDCSDVSYADAIIGCRLQELP